MAAKVKVEMRVTSWSSQRGDVVAVDKDTAAALIRNGYAVGMSQAAKDLEAEIVSTAPEPEPPRRARRK